MNRLICCTLICIFAILPSLTNGQNNYLDKKLTLQKKHTTLKVALKQLSNQTGCVFSYDPTKIEDKQEISIPSKGSVTLRTALAKVLPKGIQYKTTGKYIVLQKVTNTSVNDQPTKKPEKTAIKKPENFILPFVKPIIDSTEYKANTDTVAPGKISIPAQFALDVPDSVAKKQITVENSLIIPQTAATDKVDTVKINTPTGIIAFQLAANNHLATLSSHIGLNNLYCIISLGTDYYGSYHFGLGAGVYFHLYKRLGANIDAIQYALVAGKSKQINVKAYTTEISPALNYRIGKRMLVTLGPTIYSIRSRYSKGTSVSSLGRYLGYSGMFGISYNFSKI
ncbi:MAG: hypothetical protein PHR83_04205 [Paludibacter sp.]|nr:hypothetical protein [Paludibacter sp.]